MDVLVPVDESDPAERAIEHAVSSYPDADVTVLHVVDPSSVLQGEASVYAYESIVESGTERAERLFERTREIAADAGGTVQSETRVGRPAREIVTETTDGDYDHVVIGSHGRSGAARVLLGSVAEQVVRRSPVPVTVVR